MKEDVLSLDQIQDKARCLEITDFKGPADLVERLYEIGLRKGMQLQYFGRAPFIGPFLYRAGSTMYALRPEEAACTQVRVI